MITRVQLSSSTGPVNQFLGKATMNKMCKTQHQFINYCLFAVIVGEITMQASATERENSTWVTTADWREINDTVMGGMSQSKTTKFDNFVRFTGNLSLENSGGFASTRSPLSVNTVNKNKLCITVRGDNKVYQIRLRVDGLFDGPAFVAEFIADVAQWQTLEFTAESFSLMFRGRPFASDYQFNFDDITTVGFLISNKQQGPFTLDIQEISFK